MIAFLLFLIFLVLLVGPECTWGLIKLVAGLCIGGIALLLAIVLVVT